MGRRARSVATGEVSDESCDPADSVGIVAASGGAGIACSASSDGPGTPETTEPSVYTTADGEYHLISTINDPVLIGRWRFNEYYSTTQSLYDSSAFDNTAVRGTDWDVEVNDPTRTALGTGIGATQTTGPSSSPARRRITTSAPSPRPRAISPCSSRTR